MCVLAEEAQSVRNDGMKNVKRYNSVPQRNKGFSLVEAILSVSLFALLVTALVGVWIYGEEATQLSGGRVRAAFVAEEGLEALRNLRDQNFSNLTVGTHGASHATTWSLSGSSDTALGYTRALSISANTFTSRIATSTVTWQQKPGRFGVVDATTVFTNWLRSWQNPLSAASVNISGNDDGLQVAAQGDYVYAVRVGGTPDFVILDVTNPSAPNMVGSLSLAGSPGGIAVSGNYAYVATSDNNAEFQVISVANPAAPSVVATLNAPFSDDGIGVFVSGTRAFMTRTGSDDLVIINIANPLAPSTLSTMSLPSNPFDVVNIGNYLYLASNDNAQELQVINITNPSSPSQVGSLNLSGNSDAYAIAGFDTTVVIGRGGGSELDIVDVSNPAAPALLGSISFGGTANDITLGNGNTYVFMATSDGSSEFKVVDIFDPTTPSLVSSINTPSTLYGIAYDPIKDRAYAMSGANNQEFFVFASQP